MGDGTVQQVVTDTPHDGDSSEVPPPDAVADEDDQNEFVPDMGADDFQAYMERMRKPEPMIGVTHMVVPLIGMVLACLFLAMPFALDRAVIDADDKLVAQAELEFVAMSPEERDYRLALAQRHNSLVSGWDAWSLVSDNGGKSGRYGRAQEDIPDVSDANPEAPDGVDIAGSSSLDVSDGIIGWVSIPTGRKIAVCDSLAIGDGQANMLRHERWSEWPVGGHGTSCVLSLDKAENSDAVEQDLLGLAVGDTVVLHVLGDAYAYEVDGIDSGTTTSVMQRVAKQSKDDTLAVLVDRDSMTHIVTAHRTKFDGAEVTDITSPPVRRDMYQMVATIVAGLVVSTIFVVSLHKIRKDVKEERGGESHGN